MTSDSSELRDAVEVSLNPAPSHERPADSATKAKWVDYCVGLGADRAHLLGETSHWEPDAPVESPDLGEWVPVTVGAYVQSVALSRAELIELADRLGG